MICQLVDPCLRLSISNLSSSLPFFPRRKLHGLWLPARALLLAPAPLPPCCQLSEYSQVTLDLPEAVKWYFDSLLRNQLIFFIWTNLSPFIPLKFSMDGFQNSFINFILKCVKTQIFAFSEYIMSLLGSACFHGTLKQKDLCSVSSTCFIDSDAESKQIFVNWWALRALTSYAPNPDRQLV